MQPVRSSDPFARLEDFLEPDYKNERKSAYWGRFAETIEKFDQIMQIERKEVRESVNDIFRRKADYLRKFVDFKSAIKNQGENKPVDTLLMENQKLHKFFQRELKHIQEIIRMFVERPQMMSSLLLLYEDKRRFNFTDFALNVTNLFYSYYYLEENPNETSQFYRFLMAVMKDWNYDVENYRIRYQSIHNDLILAFFKDPHAECLIEKMSAKFISELDQPEPLIFDISIIQSQIESKKLAMKSFAQPQKKKSFFTALRQTFTGAKTDDNVKYQQQRDEQQSNSYKEALIIQKARQDRFMSVLRKSIEVILSEQLPYITKLVMRAFREKLDRQTIKLKNKNDYNRHYCSMLMTNWILSEFHSKFTMSHDEKASMTNIELQNVSQILKALTLVFQCSEPLDKNLFYRHVVNEYRPRVQNFYAKALEFGNISLFHSQMSSLMVRYEHSLKIFSFNDVKIMCDLIRVGNKHNSSFPSLSTETKELQFASSTMYTTKSRVNFRKHDYDAENIYFMMKIEEEAVLEEISQQYLGKEYPLNELPLLTEVLLKSSNLPVESALQLSKSLEFMKRLNSKQILRTLERLQENFKSLKINQTKVITDVFMTSFHRKIKDNLLNKCELTRRKNNICSQMEGRIAVIDLYKNKYKSELFYHNVTCKFITMLKIHVFVGIQDGKLQVFKEKPESIKKLQISNIISTLKIKIVGRSNVKERPQSVMNSILQNTYMEFDKVQKVIESVAQVEIARRAFTHGRKTQQFNTFFNNFCAIVSEKIGEFINEQKYLQHLNQDKFKSLLSQKLGQMLLKHLKLYDQIEKDKTICQKFQQMDPQEFYDRELASMNLEAFLFDQASISLNEIDNKKTAKEKIDQFDSLVKQIFSIISLTISREKITAEVITPIIQYVILKSHPKNCFKNLYIVECLLGEYSYETAYLMTSWTAAVTYLNSLGPELSRMSSSSTITDLGFIQKS